MWFVAPLIVQYLVFTVVIWMHFVLSGLVNFIMANCLDMANIGSALWEWFEP